MKEKLVFFIKHLNTRQVILGLSGLIIIPVLIMLTSTFTYGRLLSPAVNVEKSAGAIDAQIVVTQVVALPEQGNFIPLLLSDNPISSDPEVGGEQVAPPVIDVQPAGTAMPGQQPTPAPVKPLVQQGWPSEEEAVSRSGPTPPPGGTQNSQIMAQGLPKILNVPNYEFHYGSGPSAAGILLGYWDSLGYSDLVPGDPFAQSAGVEAMIASPENYLEYWYPLDWNGPIIPDKSADTTYKPHANNCLADYMKTSQSQSVHWAGQNNFAEEKVGLEAYIASLGLGYAPKVKSMTITDGFTWEVFKAEIDAGRPVILLIDWYGDQLTDHFLTAFGYTEVTDTLGKLKKYWVASNMYRDATVSDDYYMAEYAAMAAGVGNGIYGAILFELPAIVSGKITDANGAALAGVKVSTNTGVSATTDSSGNYTINGLLAGPYTLTPSLAGYTFSPVTRNVTIPPNATGINFTATAGSKCPSLVVNGGFETAGSWTIPTTQFPAGYDSSVALNVTAQYSMEMVHGGTRSLRTGIVNSASNIYSYSSAYQQVTIPAGVTSATLKFWIYPLSVGGVEGSGGDVQLMLILNQYQVERERLLNTRLDTRTWTQYTFDLTKYAGQTIWIYFGVYNNGYGSNMAMYVDDVSLEACNP